LALYIRAWALGLVRAAQVVTMSLKGARWKF